MNIEIMNESHIGKVLEMSKVFYTSDALDHEVKVCEPMLALDGHDDGLFFYRILAKESGKYLRENGLLMVEIGCDQAEDVMKLFRDNNYTDIRVIKDLAGLDRVVCGWRK